MQVTNATYHAVYPSIYCGTQERHHGFPICRMGNRMGHGYLAKDFYIVPGRRSSLSAIVRWLVFQVQVAAFLTEVKVNGNVTH